MCLFFFVLRNFRYNTNKAVRIYTICLCFHQAKPKIFPRDKIAGRPAQLATASKRTIQNVCYDYYYYLKKDISVVG